MAMRLLLDPGGSRLKIAEVEGGRIGAVVGLDWSELSRPETYRSQWPAGWGEAETPKVVHMLLRGVPPAAGVEWMEALASAFPGMGAVQMLDPLEHCGFPIGYTHGRPGADRIAAAVACHRDDPERAAIIVDAGTCITVDLLAPGAWRGGAILPGIGLQASAMTHAGLPQLAPRADGRWMDRDALLSAGGVLGTDTDSAIRAGIVWATRRSVEAAAGALMQVEPDARLYITGGDAAHFDGLGGWQTFADPNLVLRGGALLLHELHP